MLAKSACPWSLTRHHQVGDGTTSVVLFAGELLKEVKGYIEDNVSPQVVIKGFRKACELATARVKELALKVDKTNPKYVSKIL